MLPAGVLLTLPAYGRTATLPYKTGDYVLEGLTGFLVVIEGMNADAEQDGLNADDIKAFIEARVLNSKIHTLKFSDYQQSLTSALLDYSISTLKNPDDTYSYSTALNITQVVQTLDVPPIRCLGTIWTCGHIGSIGGTNLATIKQSSIAEDVDTFIAAFKTANV